jgi:hypothetical protein
VKTSELTGRALDWAVARCEGLSVRWDTDEDAFIYFDREEGARREWSPSTNWAQVGPIIEREKIRLDTTWNCEDGYWSARMDTVGGWWLGDTPLIAAMRCYAASKLGDELEVPCKQ